MAKKNRHKDPEKISRKARRGVDKRREKIAANGGHHNARPSAPPRHISRIPW